MNVVFIGQQAGQITVLLSSKVRAKKTPQAEARGVLTVTVMSPQWLLRRMDPEVRRRDGFPGRSTSCCRSSR